jgi:hypothetical protein
MVRRVRFNAPSSFGCIESMLLAYGSMNMTSDPIVE